MKRLSIVLACGFLMASAVQSQRYLPFYVPQTTPQSGSYLTTDEGDTLTTDDGEKILYQL